MKTRKDLSRNSMERKIVKISLNLKNYLPTSSKNHSWFNLKIQRQTSFDLNGLKNGATKHFENSLKSMQIFKILMGGMNFRERLQKNQTKVPSEAWKETNVQLHY